MPAADSTYSSEVASSPAMEVPVTLPSINPEYDPNLDAIPTARVVVREEKKTILLPDFSQKIITHRHMDDMTVDVFTEHHHTDGTTTFFERVNVPESEVALELDGPYSKDQAPVKGSSKVVPMPADQAQQHIASCDTDPAQSQEERKKILHRIAVYVILAVFCIIIAVLYAEYVFFPAIFFVIVAIANTAQLLSYGANSDSDSDSNSD